MLTSSQTLQRQKLMGKDCGNKPNKIMNAMQATKAPLDGLLSADRSSRLLCSSGSTKQGTNGNGGKKT